MNVVYEKIYSLEFLMIGVIIVAVQTFYVDEALRITRDIDDNFFVFVRES